MADETVDQDVETTDAEVSTETKTDDVATREEDVGLESVEGIVTDKDGNKMVPMSGVQKRIDALVAQRNDARGGKYFTDLVEKDPEFRERFLRGMGVDPKDLEDTTKGQDIPEPASTDVGNGKYLAWVDEVTKDNPGHKAFYQSMGRAIAEDISEFFQAQGFVRKNELDPIKRTIGDSELDRIRAKIPGFKEAEAKVNMKRRQHPTLSLEEAYYLVSGQKPASNNQEEKKRRLLAAQKGVSSPGKTVRKDMDLDDALKEAFDLAEAKRR
jgi:hypothetical protein